MADKTGKQTRTLSYLSQVAEKPYAFGFFRTVRMLDCLADDRPVTGTSYRPSEDVIRFIQEPQTAFAPSTLNSVELRSHAPKISQCFLGLFGPNGALPLHLTEYARSRWWNNHDSSFRSFADMFHHRIISLFYRAWSVGQPTVQYDRPEQDSFSRHVGSLVGVATPWLQDADEFGHDAKLHFSGHLSCLTRHRSGLESIVQGYFRVTARVIEFIAHWLTIPKRDRLVLGPAGTTGLLGQDTILGQRVWQRQDKFRIRLGPLDLDRYTDFLPTGASFKSLVAAVRNYVGLEYLWETQLVLKGEQRPDTCLGKTGTLGWTTWIGSGGGSDSDDIDDLVLQVNDYT